MNKTNSLLDAVPEETGVSSAAIHKFISSLEHCGVNMHGIVAIRSGKIIAEGYWKPFDKDRKHNMYSCENSFTSLAIGYLADEGKLSLEDHIVDYYPEKLPHEGVHPYIACTTVRDLLKMASPHEPEAYSHIWKNDQIINFFACRPAHPPGTFFSYNMATAQILDGLVNKIAGEPLLEYLKPRLLDPIGFSKDAYCSGLGLVCTPMDLAKVAFVCMRQGKYNGKQLISRWYIMEATSKQIDNYLTANSPDTGVGYGYQFWMIRNNGFAFLGMGGQIAFCFPDKDFVLALSADNMRQNNHYTPAFTALWNWLYPNLFDHALNAESSAYNALLNKLNSLEIPVLPGLRESSAAVRSSGKRFCMDENRQGIQSITFTFDNREGTIYLERESGNQSFSFGFGKHAGGRFPGIDMEYIASGEWLSKDTLQIACYIIGDILGALRVVACFHGNELTVFMKKTGECILEDFEIAVSGSLETESLLPN